MNGESRGPRPPTTSWPSGIAGIRPGFGYPACPDHSEKFKLFDLLEARGLGIDLTESAAMTPAASVSGLYFAIPSPGISRWAGWAKIRSPSYARRKGQSIEEVERWLTPTLAYEPASSARGQAIGQDDIPRRQNGLCVP